MLTLKNTEEQSEVNNESVEVTTETAKLDVNSESSPIEEDNETFETAVDDDQSSNDPVKTTILEPEIRALRRSQRIAEFIAKSREKEEELKRLALKLKLRELPEDQKQSYLREQERLAKEKNLQDAKEAVRQRRREMVEAEKSLRLNMIETGENYQKKKEAEREAKEQAARILREAEIMAAESIRLADEAKHKAEETNAEAERLADEARRRLILAQSIAKESKSKKTKNP